MTRQESTFEVAKTLYSTDKLACYKQLRKINFEELEITLGANNPLISDIKNLLIYIALTENVYDLKDINIASEIERAFTSPITTMFHDNKAFAGLLVKLASDKLLVNKQLFSSMDLTVSSFTPCVEPRFIYGAEYARTEDMEDDVIKLNLLHKTNMLTKERLDAYQPKFSELNSLLNLKISFAIQRRLFDYGVQAIYKLIENKVSDYAMILTFVDSNLNVRGVSDVKLQSLISLIRQETQGTANEMYLDKIIFMNEYTLAYSGAVKIDLLKKLKLLITKYSALNLNVNILIDLKQLKGI